MDEEVGNEQEGEHEEEDMEMVTTTTTTVTQYVRLSPLELQDHLRESL